MTPETIDLTVHSGARRAYGRIATLVEARIDALLDAERVRWSEVDEALIAPIEALRALVKVGGKRLRPVFCQWGFVGVGGDPDDPALVDAAAGLELLHTFALLHDDVMDGSNTRRGTEAVHRRFMRLHREQRWQGEDRRFGEGVAILVGDLAFVYADQLMANVSQETAAIFTELRVEVNIGQYLDLLGSVQGEPSIAAARRICVYKSGKYTIERPLHIGASLAGRLGPVQEAFTAYGIPLGEAFQLRDDLLGALGESAVTGKPVGDDLREGKPTALVARAMANATPSQRERLARIGSPDLTAAEIADLQDVLVVTGAEREVEVQIGLLRDEAIAAIERAGLTSEATTALVELAHIVTDRDR
jgi:geranylgeranyl diphosphate synthase type I